MLANSIRRNRPLVLTGFVYTSLASTPVIPSNWPVGSLVFFVDNARSGNTTPPSLQIPTGFTQLASVTTNSASTAIRDTLSYKILTAGDPGATLSPVQTSNLLRYWLICYYPTSGRIGRVVFSTVNQQATTGTPANQTIGKTDFIPYYNLAIWRGDASLTATGTNMTIVNHANSTENRIGYYTSVDNTQTIVVTSNDSGTWTSMRSLSFTAFP